MSSLSRILAEHGTLLILDGSGVPQAAWWEGAAAPVKHRQEPGEAGVGLFKAVAAICPQPDRAEAFAFCSAPGSVLGIRTAATAIRSWVALRPRPVYSYHALELAATAPGGARALIADARRGLWHLLIPGQPVQLVATGDLPAGLGAPALVTLEGYRHWEPLPAGATTQPYDVGALFSAAPSAELFSRNDSPDAALVASPSYVQWTPRIHQSP